MRFAIAVFAFAHSIGALSAEQGWLMTEPIRWIQTNLPETDAPLNPRQFISQSPIVQYHCVSPYAREARKNLSY
jgi:hypothetical protein